MSWIRTRFAGLCTAAFVAGMAAAALSPVMWWPQPVSSANTCLCQLLQFEQAIDAFRTLHGRLPDRLEELVGEDTPWGGRSIPRDPWGGEYLYRRTGDGDFTLESLGADGVRGGAGDDADIPRATLRAGLGQR